MWNPNTARQFSNLNPGRSFKGSFFNSRDMGMSLRNNLNMNPTNNIKNNVIPRGPQLVRPNVTNQPPMGISTTTQQFQQPGSM